VLNAVFYVSKTGCQWRMLPHEFPPWKTVFHYFRRWRLDGTWEALNHAMRERLRVRLGRDPQPSAGIVDSQSVKTTGVGGEQRGFDGGKKVRGRKRHLLVDTEGLVVEARVYSGKVPDQDGIRRLLEAARSRLPRLSYLWVDAGYRGRGKEWVQRALDVEVEVVNRSPKPPPEKVLRVWAREGVFLACDNNPRQVEYETSVIGAAAAAGVRRIVKLSAFGTEIGSPLAFWDWHGRIEKHLRAAGIPAVVLRPSFNMANLLGAAEQVRQEGALFAPAEGARIAMIHPRDVAAVAAVALSTDGHGGQTYVLTGPEAITYEKVAEELSAVAGRDIQFVAVPDESARQTLVRAGMPEFAAEQIVTLFEILRQGAHEQITDTVHALTGRDSRTFAEFARDHAGLFRA